METFIIEIDTHDGNIRMTIKGRENLAKFLLPELTKDFLSIKINKL